MKTTRLLTHLSAVLLCIASADRAAADTFGSGLNTFDIEFVTIGDPGNADDTTGDPNPVGSVPYSYRMGKFEISRDMVTKARITLVDLTSFGGSGVNRPATGVSWNEEARFINWLNITSGSTSAYKFAIQPGDVGYAVNANILLWNPADERYDPNNLYRNRMAKYFLPSVDEWYKAAYFDPNGGIYYNYPTGSNSIPTAVASGTTTGTAVYGQSVHTGPADITLAGGLSPYGTMGQGANVFEWEETDSDLLNGPIGSSTARGFRGGDWAINSSFLRSTFRLDEFPSSEYGNVGFRVASIPEPSTWLLGTIAGTGLLWRRRVTG